MALETVRRALAQAAYAVSRVKPAGGKGCAKTSARLADSSRLFLLFSPAK